MRDHLKEFIQDYNSGRISIVDLENRLSFDDWKNSKLNKKEHLYGDISEGALKMQIAYTSYMKIPKDPSDIIEQRFLSKERFRLILKLKRTIEKDDWDILKMIINGKKQVDIAKAKGISQGTVSNHLKKIASAAAKIGLREFMYDVATYHNNIKVNNGFNSPADIAIIGRKEGRKRICTIPEYLEQCNCKSVCVCCKKCTNEKNIIDK